MIADTHAHLNFPDYSNDIDEVVRRAKDCGVSIVINIGSGSGVEGLRRCIEISERYGFYYTVGVHPHEAGSVDLNEVLSHAGGLRVVGIGEAGLDFYKDYAPRDRQREVFKRQVEFALSKNLPLVLHIRNAMDETLKILDEMGAWEVPLIFHCFSGDERDVKFITGRGGFISFAGNVTYKNFSDGVIRAVPDRFLLLETDCPFLSPVPFRGKRNEPSFIWKTAEFVAERRGITREDVGRIILTNAIISFKLPLQVPPRIVYRIRRSLYINLTNECTLSCVFCGKRKSYFVKGHNLKLISEPDVEEVINLIKEEKDYDEVVFCGYGEPLLRLEKVKEIARKLKEMGVKRIRIDTDGLANLIHGRNVLPELKGIVDSVSVSLNAENEEVYARICPSPYGRRAFRAVCEFIREAKKYIPEVIATAVDLPQISPDEVKKLAESLGASFRLRKYNDIG